MQQEDLEINLRHILTELQHGLKDLYGDVLVDMILYGSQARGTATSESDIDVLIVLDKEVNPGEEIARTGILTSALSLKYDVVISCLFISADRFRDEQSPLLLNVRSEGVFI